MIIRNKEVLYKRRKDIRKEGKLKVENKERGFEDSSKQGENGLGNGNNAVSA